MKKLLTIDKEFQESADFFIKKTRQKKMTINKIINKANSKKIVSKDSTETANLAYKFNEAA